MMERRKPIAFIIGGHPRSGTTLLTRLCNSHPQMKVTFEFRNFREINVPYDIHVQALRKDWIRRRIVERPGQSTRIAKMESGLFLTEYLMRLQFCRKKLIDVEQVSCLLQKIFPKAQVVGDKFPEYVFHLEKLVPQESLRIAIIYRDCRDVVSSTLKRVQTSWKDQTFSANINSPAKIAESWLKAIESMEKHAHAILMICYEDLIRDPESVLRKFGDWLGVDRRGFDHQMIKVDRIGKYTTTLKEEDLQDILSVAGPTMERLGYKV